MIEKQPIARSAVTRWTAQLVLWLILVALWLPVVLPTGTGSPAVAVVGLLIFGLASLFLFYIAYHYTALAAALVRRTPGRAPTAAPSRQCRLSPVAIVMTVRDDFSETAAATMLECDYPAYRLYLCDDSQTAAGRERVNRFVRAASETVVVIRREQLTGFKAGNLNHALRTNIIKEPLLLIVDADERLASTHLRRLVEEFEHWRPAFLQASHRGVRGEGSRFQRMLAPSVSTCWSVYEQPRNREGFPSFLGHGVVIPMRLVEDLGGFDERTTSEDIEFTYRLAIWPGRACRGRVSEDVFVMEEVPISLRRYKQRFERWTRQDLRLAPTAVAHLWRGRRRVSPLEAFDLLVRQAHLPVCGLGQAYLLLFGLLLVVGTHNDEHSPWTLACVAVLAGIAAAVPVLLLGDSGFRHRTHAAVGSVWLFNSLTSAGTSSMCGLPRPFADSEFVPTGMATSLEGHTPSGEAVAALALIVLAALSVCVLLVAMGMAALGAELKRGVLRIVVNAGAAVALVVGLVQLVSYPEYGLALLPLGASRY